MITFQEKIAYDPVAHDALAEYTARPLRRRRRQRHRRCGLENFNASEYTKNSENNFANAFGIAYKIAERPSRTIIIVYSTFIHLKYISPPSVCLCGSWMSVLLRINWRRERERKFSERARIEDVNDIICGSWKVILGQSKEPWPTSIPLATENANETQKP